MEVPALLLTLHRRTTAETGARLFRVASVAEVGDYCELTGLLRNAAAQELKQWSEMPESGIGHTAEGHTRYISKQQQTDLFFHLHRHNLL